MREEQSENKMNIIQKYKYHVVKLLDYYVDGRIKDIRSCESRHVCVPNSWLKWSSPEYNIVRVWYPRSRGSRLSQIEKRVKKREKKMSHWKSFLAVLTHSTDTYEEAKKYMRHMTNSKNNNGKDQTLLPVMGEEKTCTTTSGIKSNDEELRDGLQWSVSLKSASAITLKRKASTDSDQNSNSKRTRIDELRRSDDEVAGPSSQAINNEELTRKGSEKYSCIQKTPVEKTKGRNSTDREQFLSQKESTANPSVNLKSVPIYAECCDLILELQKHLGNALVTEIITKLMNTNIIQSALTNDTMASASRDTIVKALKLNKEKTKDQQVEEHDSDGDNCVDSDDDSDDCVDSDINKHPEKKNNSLSMIKKVVPPKYAGANKTVNHDDNNELLNTEEHDSDSDSDYIDDDNSVRYDGNVDSNNKCNNVTNEHLEIQKNPLPIIKKAPKLNEEKRNEENRDNCGDDDKRRKEKKCLEPQEGLVLPPEYDANDSRWTLKYREPAKGLFELIANTGVYINATALKNIEKYENSKKFSDQDELGIALLSEVFTSSALITCSWTGRRGPGCPFVRPGLDENAREVLVQFVLDYIGISDDFYGHLMTTMSRTIVTMRRRHLRNLIARKGEDKLE